MSKTKKPKIDHENPNIKLSTCQKCKGFVRVAVEHTMKPKDKNLFSKEVLEYDLAVQTLTLSDYQELKINICQCTK